MKLTNKNNLPSPFIKAIEYYDKQYKKNSISNSISTTTLLKPVQAVTLEKRYNEKIEVDASDKLFALEGQILHHMLELAEPDKTKVENRVSTQIDGYTVSGQYDLIEDGILIDWKYTSVWKVIYPNDEWEQQSNINRFLLHKNGVKIEKLVNIVMCKDFKPSEAGQGNYPSHAVMAVPLPLWTLEDTEKFIRGRLRLFKKAEEQKDVQLPSCTEKERWWNKKKKLNMRCEKYCLAKPFCHQYKKLKEENNDD